ncbi:hypothetical protein NM688_g3408 [Phlebia brevispora]|uniref:Uncharacterized protein n=1 Tax=Phlebia brevispora TaxID=194682 RepID=A0ACC1T5S6_9APHY|nr:hypothetical protein NM688_g3408 [Phlebia brevispora]
MVEVQFASRRTSTLLLITVFLLFNLCYDWTFLKSTPEGQRTVAVPLHAEEISAKCRSLQLTPGPPLNFYNRSVSDRYEVGTKPVLVRNAKIWTGGVQGLEVLDGDLLLAGGIIRAVGHVGKKLLEEYSEITVIEAHGAWVTPGLIDVHSHLGDLPSPVLEGAVDGNSFKGLAQPWLRSVDALNTHDDGYASAVAGGLTTALILPGSANAIGGQAFSIKLRPTKERSPTSMLLEPSFGYNSSDHSLRWRHIKHACGLYIIFTLFFHIIDTAYAILGENPSRLYSGTRMDTFWAFRQAYDTARSIKESQDEYCSNVFNGDWASVSGKSFPESLQWEALVDVLRGRVKVQTHCYEAVDIDDFIRLSNEFKFPVAAFHHAHEAWLVPDVLKRGYEHPPAIAMFAAFARYKREAYRHSEFAPRVLADNDIDVVMKSDHAAIVSRYLVHEAAQAHYWGLPENTALCSVITTPAKVLGLDHRIGYIKQGYDADIVIWDSHPLSLGATPSQVFIDGIPQISFPSILTKPTSLQKAPATPDFEQEIKDAVKHEGLPPLTPLRTRSDVVLFTNVSNLWLRDATNSVWNVFENLMEWGPGEVVVHDGRILCHGITSGCAAYSADATVVDLQRGSLQPGLVTAGSALGLQEIGMEETTTDGAIYNPLGSDVPSLALGLPRAVDGLMYGTRDALLAYRAGVTVGISALHGGFLSGSSTAFSTGSLHKLEQGAIVQKTAAVHVSLAHGDVPSVSTEIAVLRRLLLSAARGTGDESLQSVAQASGPLSNTATNSADIIPTVIQMKQEVEDQTGTELRITILGGSEAHILAPELAEAKIGVILYPPRPYPYMWDNRRVIPGRPVTNDTTIATLVKAGVTVGLGPQGTNATPMISAWAVRNLRFDAGWALLDNPDVLSQASVLAMASSNVEKLLGVHVDPYEADLVATSGGDLLSFEGKVVAVISPRRGRVDFFE